MADSFPPWQELTLKKLKEMFESNNGSFPDNRDIVKAMKDVPEVQKYMKKLMPFVQNYKVNLISFVPVRVFHIS